MKASRRAVLGLCVAACWLVSASAHAQTPPALRAELVYSISGTAGTPFGDVQAVALTPASEVVVLDAMAKQVSVFGMGGDLIAKWGAEGGGPGEFRRPVSLMAVDTTVVVLDVSRVSRFSSRGDLLRTTSLDVGIGLPVSLAATQRGRTAVVFLNPRGSHAAVVFPDSSTEAFAVPTPLVKPLELFGPRPIFAEVRDGVLAVGRSDRYELSLVDLESGSEVMEIKRNVEQRPVPRTFREEVLHYLQDPSAAPEGWSSIIGGGTRNISKEILSRISFAEFFPLIAQVVPGPASTIWVRRGVGIKDRYAVPIEPPDNAIPLWDIFDHTGAYQGVVRLPDGFTAYASTGRLIAGIFRGNFGEESVRVYRVADDWLEGF